MKHLKLPSYVEWGRKQCDGCEFDNDQECPRMGEKDVCGIEPTVYRFEMKSVLDAFKGYTGISLKTFRENRYVSKRI